MNYEIKCDECKTEIGTTDSLRESAEGGMCPPCRQERLSVGAVEVQRGSLVTRFFYSHADTLGRRSYIDYIPSARCGQGFFQQPTTLD